MTVYILSISKSSIFYSKAGGSKYRQAYSKSLLASEHRRCNLSSGGSVAIGNSPCKNRETLHQHLYITQCIARYTYQVCIGPQCLQDLFKSTEFGIICEVYDPIATTFVYFSTRKFLQIYDI